MFGISDHDLMFSQDAKQEIEEPEEQQFIQQKVGRDGGWDVKAVDVVEAVSYHWYTMPYYVFNIV